jgi:hypothetical protein
MDNRNKEWEGHLLMTKASMDGPFFPSLEHFENILSLAN